MKKIKKEKGITLVALIVTIVILLILAGISISSLTNTGIFDKAKEVQKVSENAEKEQKNILSEYEDEIYNNASTSKVENCSVTLPLRYLLVNFGSLREPSLYSKLIFAN